MSPGDDEARPLARDGLNVESSWGLADNSTVAADGPARAARNADSWWWSTASTGIEWLSRTRSSFTVDDLRDLGVPEADDPCRWGSLIAAAWRSGRIEPVGASVSARDGRLVRVWAGVAR